MAKARKSTSEPSPEAEGHGHDYRDRVAMRAYELYLARGAGDGRDFDDWLAAERELASANGGGERGDETE